MTNIVVLIKQVPDTWSERKLSDGDFTLDRDAADADVPEGGAAGVTVPGRRAHRVGGADAGERPGLGVVERAERAVRGL